MAKDAIRMYTGLLGHGKTLKAVYDLVEEIGEDNQLPPSEQRHIYTNISGLKIQGALPAPDDWRECPNNSIIVYDEADLIDHYASSRKSETTDLVRELKLARKRGVSVWFIVQDPSMLHAFIRRIVGEHIHIVRPLGAEVAKCYHFNQTKDKPTDFLTQKSADRVYLFKYPKHLFDFYDSVEKDTKHRQKFQMPENWVKGITFVVSLILLAGYFAWQFSDSSMFADDDVFPDDIDTKVDTDIQTPTLDKSQSSFVSSSFMPDPSFPESDEKIDLKTTAESKVYNPLFGDYYESQDLAISAVLMMGDTCRAYNKKGQRVAVSHDDCVLYIKDKGNMAVY